MPHIEGRITAFPDSPHHLAIKFEEVHCVGFGGGREERGLEVEGEGVDGGRVAPAPKLVQHLRVWHREHPNHGSL